MAALSPLLGWFLRNKILHQPAGAWWGLWKERTARGSGRRECARRANRPHHPDWGTAVPAKYLATHLRLFPAFTILLFQMLLKLRRRRLLSWAAWVPAMGAAG